MPVNALEETLSDISSLLGFEIQLKPEQRKSIINLLRGEDVIAILPTLRDTEKVWSFNYTLSPNQSLLHASTSRDRIFLIVVLLFVLLKV